MGYLPMNHWHSFICDEPEGRRRRIVMPVSVEPTRVLELWDRLQRVPNMFLGYDTGLALQDLMDINNYFYTVDDVGMIGAMNGARDFAHVHITFWDRRLRGRELLCREMAKWFQGIVQKEILTAIPQTARVVLAFAKRVGFKEHANGAGFNVLLFSP